jgi:hypothetical protein
MALLTLPGIRHLASGLGVKVRRPPAFRRHPVMHGRCLAFGTETNSTKAFALTFAATWASAAGASRS